MFPQLAPPTCLIACVCHLCYHLKLENMFLQNQSHPYSLPTPLHLLLSRGLVFFQPASILHGLSGALFPVFSLKALSLGSNQSINSIPIRYEPFRLTKPNLYHTKTNARIWLEPLSQSICFCCCWIYIGEVQGSSYDVAPRHMGPDNEATMQRESESSRDTNALSSEFIEV